MGSEARCKECVAQQQSGHLRTPTASPELLAARARLALAGLLHPRLGADAALGPCVEVMLEVIGAMVEPGERHRSTVRNSYVMYEGISYDSSSDDGCYYSERTRGTYYEHYDEDDYQRHAIANGDY